MPAEVPTPTETRNDAAIAKVVENQQKIDRKLRSKKALKVFLEHGKLLLQLVLDYFKGNYREIPYWAIGAAALALVYVLSPVDMLPDIIPGLGYLDDATILAFCIKLLEVELDRYREWRKTHEAQVVEEKAVPAKPEVKKLK